VVIHYAHHIPGKLQRKVPLAHFAKNMQFKRSSLILFISTPTYAIALMLCTHQLLILTTLNYCRCLQHSLLLLV
jgi:hypothetical protein